MLFRISFRKNALTIVLFGKIYFTLLVLLQVSMRELCVQPYARYPKAHQGHPAPRAPPKGMGLRLLCGPLGAPRRPPAGRPLRLPKAVLHHHAVRALVMRHPAATPAKRGGRRSRYASHRTHAFYKRQTWVFLHHRDASAQCSQDDAMCRSPPRPAPPPLRVDPPRFAGGGP
jgi:hypothetical protein